MRRIGILMLVFFFCCVSTAWPQAQQQTKPQIITFDVPGAGKGAGQGTVAYGINAWGAIIGWYTDDSNVNHGFVRFPNRKTTTFDAPNAAACSTGGGGTVAYGINSWGFIVGNFTDSSCVSHGFVRSPDGKMKQIDYKDAGIGPGQGTFALNINDAGEIVGTYIDGSNVTHVLLLTADWKFTTFDVTGQSTGVPTMYGLNAWGMITGEYDVSGVSHGYLRAANGKYVTFDDPNVGANGQGTSPWSLNVWGEVAGTYDDANWVTHGFLRSPNGKMTTYDAPGAVGGTFITSNNDSGAITGFYVDAGGNVHGFEYGPGGKFIGFDAPGAVYGTYSNGNNAAGWVMGNYVDANGASHGFLLIPEPYWNW